VTFGRPELLWLLALGLPVVAFHLIRRRRRRLAVPALLLWEEVLRSAPRRFGLRALSSLLALLLVLLALAAAVGAAADPRTGSPAPEPRHLLLLISNSARMEGDRFGRAVRIALAEVERKAGVDPVTVLLVSERPRILATRETDPGRIEEALRAAEPVLAAADWETARAAAERVLEAEGSRVVAIGVRPAVPDGVAVRPVGGENAGISAFGVRVRETRVDLWLRASGFAEGAEVVISLAGEEVQRAPAAEEMSLTVERGEGGLLGVALEPASGPTFDDRVEAFLPAALKYRVAVISEGGTDPFLKAALAVAGPIVDLANSAAVPPDRLAEAAAEFDVVVAAGSAPERLPPGRYILITPPPAALGFSALPPAEVSPIWERAGNHPVLDGVDPAEVQVVGAAPARLPPRAEPLLTVPGGAVAAAGEHEGARYVWIGLDPENSTLPVTGAFPLLVRNALRWFVSLDSEPLPPAVSVGEPIVPVTALPRGTSAVACEGPTDRDHAVLTVEDGTFAYLPDSRADGEVIVRIGGAIHRTRVNAILPRETTIAPLEDDAGSGEDRSGLRESERRLWKLFAAAAGLFLVLEWGVFWLTRGI